MTLQSFERALKQPKQSIQTWMLLLLSLVSLLLVSGRLYAVPTMEFFAAGGNTTAQGPVLTPQVNTYSYNPNNPTDNAVVGAFPATSITYTLENQQYTSGTLANNGLFFGDSFAPQNIYIPLSGQGSPANTDFSSSRLNLANPQGIDIAANYGQRMALNTSRLNGVLRRNTTAINGGLGHYFGDIVLTWNRPVLNPIVNVSGLGGTGGNPTFGFAAQFELSNPPAGTTMSLLSGRNTAVTGLTIRNNATTIGATAAAGGASGSIQILNTNPITSLRFRIYVRSSYTTDTTNTNWGTNTGDAFLFSSSSVDAVVGDLFVSKTNNVTSVTSGGSTTYTVRVTNNGPSTIDSAILNDVIGTGLSATSVVCSAAASNRCTTAPNLANLISAGVTLPSLASGQFYEINVTTNVTVSSGSVTNSTTIQLPASNIASNTGTSCVTSGGVTRSFNTTTGACTSTDTDTVTAAPISPDPAINEARFTILPDLPTIFRGGTGAQLVTITNNGPSSATGTVATFIPATQTGVSVTAVNVVGGAACTLSGGEWSCPVGGVANGANFQLNVTYSTTAASSLGVAQQATIKVRSNEFNPGSGVGETLYKVWGSNQQEETRPNGAFWVGYTGTGGAAQVGANSDENTPVLNAWPAGQTSPTGAYLTQANIDSRTSVYGASSTTASPMIQRVVTDMSTDADRSVNLTSIAATSAGDNRRAWEYRTGVYVPTAQSVSFCIGNTTLGIDDNAYIVVDGVVQGVQDSYVPGGFVSASLSLSAGYHSITYRMVNQNTYAAGAERDPGGYGQIGISLGGTCNTANLDAWTNTAVPASINIIDAADLQITKTNSVTAVDAAGTTSYAVVVTNAGPSAANNALFRDVAAAGLTKTSITCTATGGAVCPTAPISVATVEGATGIAIPTLPSGGTVTFTVNANVTATSGSVANTATVTAPAGVTEIDPANNTATDTDTVTPRADLSITKTNSVTAVDAGSSTAYTVVVSNAGPSAANGALFRDIAAAGLSKTTITCTATGSAVCPTAPISIVTVEGATGIAIPTLPSGGTVTFTVNANVTATSGSVANTATVTAPAGVTEIDPANNTATDTDTVTPRADLSITKTNSVTAVDAGSSTAYTVVVSNAGPSAANGALFRDIAAAGLSKTTITCTATGSAVCPTAPISIVTVEGATGIAIPTLPSGGTVTFTVNANVTATSGSVANTATVTAPAGVTEINAANNTATDTDTVTPAVDLVVVKSQRAGTTGAFQTSTVSVLVLGTVQYQLVFTNNGPSVVTGATLSDSVPAQFNTVSVVSATGANGATACSASNTGNNVSGTWSGPSGATCTVVIQARAGLTTGTYTNTATTAVPSGTVETNNANNSSSVQTAIAPAADLAIVKTQRIGTTGAFVGTALSVNQLQTVQYQLVLTNNGPTTATAATYTDAIPANITGLTVVGTPTTTGIGTVCAAPTFIGQTLNGTFTAAQNGTCTVTVQGTATTTGSITNTATITAVGVTDTVAGNNSSSVDMTIILAADLSITKTNGVAAVDAGSSTAYTIAVTNAGPSAANGALFRDIAATGLSKTSITCTATGGAVCPTAPIAIATVEGATGIAIPTLPSGGTVTFTVNANITATSGSVANTATVTAPAGVTEINAANNTATDTDTVTPRADLSITKTNGVAAVDAGSTTAYTVVVSNAGPSAANGALFRDIAAAGLSKTTITCTATGGAVCPTAPISIVTVEGATGIAIPTLPSGGVATFTVNASVTATSGNVTNTATVTAPAGTTEINTANNTATDTDTVNALVNITGRVFTDNSGTTAVAANAYNGLQNTGELGLAGSTVQLNNCAGSVIATTQTDAAGDYSFGVLLPALSTPSFCITQTNLAGYTSVSGTAGYARATDTITLTNTAVLSYTGHNFGDARLTLVLTSDGQQTTTPSGTVSYPHILRSEAVLDVGVLNTVTSESPTLDWTTTLYRDNNCNGVIDAGEQLLINAIGLLLPTQEICVVQRVNAPATASNGAQHVATLSASYTATVQGGDVLSGSSNTRTDTTLVGTAGLDMRKQVRVVASCPSTGADVAAFTERNTAQNGDFLEYQIIYTNRSTRNLSQLTVRDVAPSSTTFQSATCQSTPSGSSCTAPVTAGVNGDLAWSLTNIAPAATGSVRFCVRVPPLAAPPLK